MLQLVSGQLPPRKIARKMAPWMTAPPGLLLAPLGNCFEDDCPRGKLPPPHRKIATWMITTRIFAPDDCPEDKCPWAIVPRNIFGWILVTFPETNPMKIVPTINYTRDIFSRRIGNRNTLIDSCFFMFFSFGI